MPIEKSDDAPFFLNLWHYAVHTPIQTPENLVEKHHKKAADSGLNEKNAIELGEPFPTEHKKHLRVERRRFQSDPAYAAMIENLDWNIGRLLKSLEERGKSDKTLVIFTSDNGGLSTAEGSPTSNAPLHEGKGWMYEGGTREPLLMRWPGKIRAGTRCETPVSSPDFYPTWLEAAELPLRPAQHCDGENLMPLLRGENSLKREAIFWHYPHYGNQGGTPGSSIRAGDWKLLEFFETGEIELYNLREDIEESRDLSKEKPELAARLQFQLRQWRESVEAKIPVVNPDWSNSRPS